MFVTFNNIFYNSLWHCVTGISKTAALATSLLPIGWFWNCVYFERSIGSCFLLFRHSDKLLFNIINKLTAVQETRCTIKVKKKFLVKKLSYVTFTKRIMHVSINIVLFISSDRCWSFIRLLNEYGYIRTDVICNWVKKKKHLKFIFIYKQIYYDNLSL